MPKQIWLRETCKTNKCEAYSLAHRLLFNLLAHDVMQDSIISIKIRFWKIKPTTHCIVWVSVSGASNIECQSLDVIERIGGEKIAFVYELKHNETDPRGYGKATTVSEKRNRSRPSKELCTDSAKKKNYIINFFIPFHSSTHGFHEKKNDEDAGI